MCIQWSLVSYPPLILTTWYNKGLSKLPFHGQMTTKQNLPGPCMNRSWFFRKQDRGWQWSRGPDWGLEEMLELPALLPCCISVLCSVPLPVKYLFLLPVVPNWIHTSLFPKFTVQPTPNGSSKLTMDCSFPKDRIEPSAAFAHVHQQWSWHLFYIWYFWHCWMVR